MLDLFRQEGVTATHKCLTHMMTLGQHKKLVSMVKTRVGNIIMDLVHTAVEQVPDGW